MWLLEAQKERIQIDRLRLTGNLAVIDGVITQDQADLIIEQLANGAGMMGKFGPNSQFGGSRGPGGFGGRGFDGASALSRSGGVR